MREAMFYEKGEGKEVRCGLCRFRCRIAEGGRGICGVRENRAGVLYTLVYGKAVAEQVDPVEKKPLFHFLPGTLSYSIATVGCNFRCLHCQNYGISQLPQGHPRISGTDISPEEIVRRATESGCRSISYTYTEPTIYFEYAYETARLARQAGLRNIFVTNGYITAEALACIAPYLDAANIDLKGFSEKFYREVVHAMLGEVLESLKEYRRRGIWVEVTTLVIPGLNDSDEDLSGIAGFIAGNLGSETPWHVTGFYPTYRLLDRPPTPADTLRKGVQIGRGAGLRHVYAGNVPDAGGEDTLCYGCGEPVVSRRGYRVLSNRIVTGKCGNCSAPVAGVWE